MLVCSPMICMEEWQKDDLACKSKGLTTFTQLDRAPVFGSGG